MKYDLETGTNTQPTLHNKYRQQSVVQKQGKVNLEISFS